MPFDPEPSPEFNARLNEIFDAWEHGVLSFRDASVQLEAMATEASEPAQPANQGRVELFLGIMQGYRANLDASIGHFERARGFFEQAGNRRRAIGCVLNLGESYRLKGSFARARQLFRAAYDGAITLKEVSTQALAAFNEGQMLLSMGHPESARKSVEDAYRISALMINETDHEARVELQSDIISVLAQIYLQLGDFAKAWEYSCDALQRARQIAQPLQLGIAHRAMGEVLTELPEHPVTPTDISLDPDDHFRLSTESFQEIKAEGEMARSVYTHALSLTKRGKGLMAARKMQQAMIIFTRLGMNDDAAKAARAQIDVLARATSDTKPLRNPLSAPKPSTDAKT